MTELPKVADPAQVSSAGAAALAAALRDESVDYAVHAYSHTPEQQADAILAALAEQGMTLVPTAECERLREDGPDLVFSTSPAPEGIDTDCMFLASVGRISVHISRRAINAQVARALLAALAATDVVADTERETV